MFLSSVFHKQLGGVLITGLLLGIVLLDRAPAQQAESPTELAGRIDRLIVELDSDNFDVREKATASLVEIGDAAVAKVTAATKDASSERRQRAAMILAGIRKGEVGLLLTSQIEHPTLSGTVTVALSPDEKFVYSHGFKASAVNVFRRDAKTGELTHLQELTDPQFDGLVRLRLSKDGKLAVAPSFSAKTVALFSRDKDSGKLTLLSVQANDADGDEKLAFPVEAVFSTDGKFVYVGDSSLGSVLVFKVVDGKKLEWVESYAGIERCFHGVRGVSVHPDGKTIYVSARSAKALTVLDRDPETGKLSVRQILRDEEGDIHGLSGVMGTEVSTDGKFVYSIAGRFEEDNAVGVYKVGADGKLTLIQELCAEKGEIKDFTGGSAFVISPDGRRAYASGTTSGSLAGFSRDPENGKLTYLTTLQTDATGHMAGLGANGMKISSDGTQLYLALEDTATISVFKLTGGTSKK